MLFHILLSHKCASNLPVHLCLQKIKFLFSEIKDDYIKIITCMQEKNSVYSICSSVCIGVYIKIELPGDPSENGASWFSRNNRISSSILNFLGSNTFRLGFFLGFCWIDARRRWRRRSRWIRRWMGPLHFWSDLSLEWHSRKCVREREREKLVVWWRINREKLLFW